MSESKKIKELRDFYEQWEQILIHFDWERVQTTMRKLDWKWHSLDTVSVPTKDDIIRCAKRLCQQAHSNKGSSSTGGLQAALTDGSCLSLEFILTSWEVYLDDEEREDGTT